MTEAIAKNVIDFWFGEQTLTPERHRERAKVWFQASADFDYDIERRFGKLVSAARAGAFDRWADTPENQLALILILDQFPRNLYRGTALAFASDDKALTLTQAMIERDQINALHPSRQGFALMPFQHCEDFDCQTSGLAEYEKQLASATPEWRGVMQGFADSARSHLELIGRFGRFPHRNAPLGRQSTPEEEAYLNEGGSRFGQG